MVLFRCALENIKYKICVTLRQVEIMILTKYLAVAKSDIFYQLLTVLAAQTKMWATVPFIYRSQNLCLAVK